MPGHAKARVLTVEDDPIVRADIRSLLDDAGFDVCPDARDGLEAVELARTLRPDLVLIDLNLPGLDGIEATRRILRERRVAVVALTGHRRGDRVERAHAAGAVAHVLKPFHESDLIGTLRSALSAHVSDAQYDARALAEEDDYRDRAFVESMVSRSYSKNEIEAALRRGYH